VFDLPVELAGFNPRHWMRTTSPVVAENFGLGVGFSLTENVGQKMLHFPP